MKKVIIISLVVLFASACHREPLPELDGEYLVYTNKEGDFDFSTVISFYLDDSLLVKGQSPKPQYSTSENAKALILQVKDNMEERGFTRSGHKDEADVEIRMAYVLKKQKFIPYSSSTLLIDMYDLNKVNKAGEKAEPVWSAYIGGPYGMNLKNDIVRMKLAIDQAFIQSSYLEGKVK